jgi:serine/threonine-protein kinase PpkA
MSMYEEGVFSNTPPPQARLIADNVAESVSQDHDMVILRVRPEPSDARVRVINIAPAYRDGMDLEPGSYDIEVTAPGYRTFRGWHESVPGNWALDVTLEPEPDR